MHAVLQIDEGDTGGSEGGFDGGLEGRQFGEELDIRSHWVLRSRLERVGLSETG